MPACACEQRHTWLCSGVAAPGMPASYTAGPQHLALHLALLPWHERSSRFCRTSPPRPAGGPTLLCPCRGRALSPKRTAKRGTARPLSQSTPARVMAESLGLQRVPQRYYPQCTGCSQKQAAAVRANRRTLRMHFGGLRAWHFAGPCAALRADGRQPCLH